MGEIAYFDFNLLDKRLLDANNNNYTYCMTMPQAAGKKVYASMVFILKSSVCSPWRPVIDGKFSKTPFVRDDPEVLLESGDFKSVPVIMGTTSEECVRCGWVAPT